MLSPSFLFDFLSLLTRFVTWELVSRKPTLLKETLPDILRLKKIEQKDGSSFPLFTLTKRSKSLFFKRETLPRESLMASPSYISSRLHCVIFVGPSLRTVSLSV